MAAIDNFVSGRANNPLRSAGRVILVTPNDSTDLAYVTRGVSFAVAGALEVIDLANQTVVIPSGALAAGIIHPIEVTRIKAANTTATGIVAYAGV